MDKLNSQSLTPHNSFLHVFRDAGDFTFSVQVGFNYGKQYTVTVEKSDSQPGEGQQYDVPLRWENEVRSFVSDVGESSLKLKQHDFLSFRFEQPIRGQPPCYIVGRARDTTIFDSRNLKMDEAFSHFFVTPGHYEYAVNHRVYSLDVADHREMPADELDRKIAQVCVITLTGDAASPEHAKLVCGQSVIWVVEKGENLSIVAQHTTYSHNATAS